MSKPKESEEIQLKRENLNLNDLNTSIITKKIKKSRITNSDILSKKYEQINNYENNENFLKNKNDREEFFKLKSKSDKSSNNKEFLRTLRSNVPIVPKSRRSSEKANNLKKGFYNYDDAIHIRKTKSLKEYFHPLKQNPQMNHVYKSNFEIIEHVFTTALIENEVEGKNTLIKPIKRPSIFNFFKYRKSYLSIKRNTINNLSSLSPMIKDKSIRVKENLQGLGSYKSNLTISKKNSIDSNISNIANDANNANDANDINNVIEANEINYDTDNSFIRIKIKLFIKKNKINDARNVDREYKKMKDMYKIDVNHRIYKKNIYIPLLIKYTKKILIKLTMLKIDKENENFYKYFKMIFEAFIDKNNNILVEDNLEYFIEIYMRYIFEKVIKDISKKIYSDNLNYIKCKSVFAKLYNNIKRKMNLNYCPSLRSNNKKLNHPNKDIYNKLSENIYFIMVFKSKNFYLHETLSCGISDLMERIKQKRTNRMIEIITTCSNKISIKTRENYLIKKGNKINRGVLLPYSSYRILWDVIISICVIYNMIFIPIYFTEVYLNGIYFTTGEIIDMIIDGISFLDIVLNFRTGYLDESNNIVTDLKEIKMNYIKTWLLMDICSTFPWEVLMFGSNGKILNLFKLPRVLRINRLIKLTEKINKSLVRLIILVFMFFLFAHWIGSFCYALFDYFFIKDNFSQQEKSYCISTNILGGNDFNSECKYIYSLYIGMSILSVQSINLPETETIRNAIILLSYFLGQLAFSIIIGLMSYSVKNMKSMFSAFSDRISLINNILNFYRIDGEIRNHINIFYQYIWIKHKEMTISDDCMATLSKILQEKILAQRFKKIISKLDFINKFHFDDHFLGQFLTFIQPRIYLPFEIIFHEGLVTEGLYVIEKGFVLFEVVSLDGFEKEKYSFSFPKKRKSLKYKNVNAYSFYSIYNKSISNGVDNRGVKDLRLCDYLNNEVRGVDELPQTNVQLNNYITNKLLDNTFDSKGTFKQYFDIISLMTTSSRHWCTSYSTEFCEIAFIKYEQLFKIFEENQILMTDILREAKTIENDLGIFRNTQIFRLINIPSSRTNKTLYKQGRLNQKNIWIDMNETLILDEKMEQITKDIHDDCDQLQNFLDILENPQDISS